MFKMKQNSFLQNTRRNKQIFFIVAILFFLCVAAFCAFYQLGNGAVNSWDEARHGVNAYEMWNTGSKVVNLYGYVPDYWNLKPPLSFAAIEADLAAFGTTIFARRFYSALAMFLTVLISSIFVWKRYGRVACLVTTALLSCQTLFYHFHYGRSGDADALFGLLCTCCVLALFQVRKNKYWVLISALCFSFAFLDKSWHACILLAVAGIFLLFSGQLIRFGVRVWAGMLGCAFIPIAIWFFCRYQADGWLFFRQMIHRDLLARSATPLEGHGGDLFYYFRVVFLQNGFGLLALASAVFAIFCVITWTKKKKRLPHDEPLLFSLWILLPFILFSLAATKYLWYIIPTVVPLCIFCGMMCGRVWTHSDYRLNRILRVLFIILTIFVVGANARITISLISHTSLSPIQQFLTDNNLQSAHGKKAYILYADGTSNWQQSEVYVGEAYDDFRCQNGGLAAFLKNENGVAVLSKKYIFQHEIPSNTYVAYQKDDFVLLLHD
ncbi:MAG TPA: hypothetical protein DEP42_04865 [Ruminococcaceae bacterium]|nr:hypothetical protein [Oscillospiraceae bacterium]